MDPICRDKITSTVGHRSSLSFVICYELYSAYDMNGQICCWQWGFCESAIGIMKGYFIKSVHALSAALNVLN